MEGLRSANVCLLWFRRINGSSNTLVQIALRRFEARGVHKQAICPLRALLVVPAYDHWSRHVERGDR